MKVIKIIARAILILPIVPIVIPVLLIATLLEKLGEAGEWLEIETDYRVRRYLVFAQKLLPFNEAEKKGARSEN